jgi:hypothetical protein
MSLDPRNRATTGCCAWRGFIVRVGGARIPSAAFASEATQADVPCHPTERIQRGMLLALPRATGFFEVCSEGVGTKSKWLCGGQIIKIFVGKRYHLYKWGAQLPGGS